MTAEPPNKRTRQATAPERQSRPLTCVLVVEPEDLVRWSLVTYLGKWFEVCSADCGCVAERILDDRKVDAVVLSDDLSDQAAEDVEAHARARNPAARVVRTVTGPPGEKASNGASPRLEKPFELSRLAVMLGVQETICSAPECRDA